jgi:hypothetical protein
MMLRTGFQWMALSRNSAGATQYFQEWDRAGICGKPYQEGPKVELLGNSFSQRGDPVVFQ